ncbi:hypothetical protein FACS189487_04190 [Campylobacterota bacterium]|nr:hypothetical protein FACS189487_04190 [Campylobacterota bacterium]
MRDAVLSARIDGATLVLKLTSHAMKSEYYNKRDQILGIYKILRRETRHFEGIELNSFKLFVDHNSDFLPKPRKDETYSERARGRFENTAENSVVFEAIERLRETIKKNADI